MSWLFAQFVWDASPELIRVGPLAVRWYGLLFALLFWVGYLIVREMFRVEGKSESSLGDLLTYLVAGTIIGARLGECLFYDPVYYLQHPLEIIKIWEGGLASHGGAIGVLAALYLYSRRHPDQPYLWLLDRIAVPTALAACFIRIGNFFNSEILGVPAKLPWAVVFVRADSVNGPPRHPAQLYEAAAYLAIFVVVLLVYQRWRAASPPGLLLGLFLIAVFTARFLIEFIKEEQAAYARSLPLTVGQWLSIPFVLAGAWLLAAAWRRRPRQA